MRCYPTSLNSPSQPDTVVWGRDATVLLDVVITHPANYPGAASKAGAANKTAAARKRRKYADLLEHPPQEVANNPHLVVFGFESFGRLHADGKHFMRLVNSAFRRRPTAFLDGVRHSAIAFRNLAGEMLSCSLAKSNVRLALHCCGSGPLSLDS